MLKETYAKVYKLTEKYKGYIHTSALLKEGLTNRQIAEFVQNGMLEKICHGVYWFSCADYGKPADYKAIEISRSDPRAVICADSACFYQGLIDVEPPSISVATSRDDRSKLTMPFPVSRHYFSENNFFECRHTVSTEFGEYMIYGIERSVCDCIRFRDEIRNDIFCYVIECYRKLEKKDTILRRYAERLRIVSQVEYYFFR